MVQVVDHHCCSKNNGVILVHRNDDMATQPRIVVFHPSLLSLTIALVNPCLGDVGSVYIVRDRRNRERFEFPGKNCFTCKEFPSKKSFNHVAYTKNRDINQWRSP